MNLSFHEKSLCLLLLSLLAAFGAYFASVLPAASANIAPIDVVKFTLATATLALAQVLGHIVLGVIHRRELAGRVQTDERDQAIGAPSAQVASHVLAAGVFTALCVAVWVPGNFAFAHVLLAFWVLAQATELAAQLVMQRRGF